MTTIFLFAHQDDEIGVFHEISTCIESCEDIRCVYLTNGAWAGVSPERRNSESLKVLGKLGVRREQVIFLGNELQIYDGTLIENLGKARTALIEKMQSIKTIKHIFMHAWEGGHQDHDAVHLVGLSLAHHHGLLERSFQYPLYRMPAGRFSLSFAAPLPTNGTTIHTKIPLRQRLRNLGLILHYKSQRRVMAKILPHLIWDYLKDGTQKVQPVSLQRASVPPIEGQMLYEYWKLYTAQNFWKQAQPFIKKHLAP